MQFINVPLNDPGEPDDPLSLFTKTLDEVERMAREFEDPYWQGKKDGMRIAYIILQDLINLDDPDEQSYVEKQGKSMRMVQITADSPYTKYTKTEEKVLDR